MNSKSRKRPYVYVSGALSGLCGEEFARVAAIYDVIGAAANDVLLPAYCPHRSPTAPGRPMEPALVWRTDLRRVSRAGLVIAYVGVPSLGVGSEIEMARAAGVPVVLAFEADRQARISRLILGSPAIQKLIPFDDAGDLRRRLMACIPALVITRMPGTPNFNLERLAQEILASAKKKVSGQPTGAVGHPSAAAAGSSGVRGEQQSG